MTNDTRRTLAAALMLETALLSACGGRPRAPKPAGEGMDMETAILTCNFDRVKALVEEDPAVIDNKPRGRYQYPIALAAQASRICGPQTFTYLLDQDPQMNVILLNEALKAAARNSDLEMVTVLLKHGADANGDDSNRGPGLYNDTPLQAVLLSGWWMLQDPQRKLQVAEALVAAGARLDVPAAAAMGHTRQLRALLTADPSLADAGKPYQLKPMDWAARYHQKESAKVLVEFIPNPPFKYLITAGDERAVRDYLAHHPGAAKLKTEESPYSREYPITVAARSGDRDMVKLLLDNGADPNTPWMMEEIVRKGDVDMVKFLIEHGTDVRDKPGVPRLVDTAVNAKHPEIADIIRQAQ